MKRRQGEEVGFLALLHATRIVGRRSRRDPGTVIMLSRNGAASSPVMGAAVRGGGAGSCYTAAILDDDEMWGLPVNSESPPGGVFQ